MKTSIINGLVFNGIIDYFRGTDFPRELCKNFTGNVLLTYGQAAKLL